MRFSCSVGEVWWREVQSSSSIARYARYAFTRERLKCSSSLLHDKSSMRTQNVTAQMTEVAVRTGHVDTFCADRLPPTELWPVRDWTRIPELTYPERLNCAAELLDRLVESGSGERLVFRYPGGKWTYGRLLETSNRIAH